MHARATRLLENNRTYMHVAVEYACWEKLNWDNIHPRSIIGDATDEMTSTCTRTVFSVLVGQSLLVDLSGLPLDSQNEIDREKVKT
jgi:hypothetical protein